MDVAVVIPTRDRPERLRAAVASALAQEGVAIEVIVVDDGSRVPVTPAAGARLVRHESSRGVAEARNAGVAAARAEWVAFLDDDDLWAPHKLRTQVAAALGQGSEWSYGSALVVDVRGRVVEVQPAPDPRKVGALMHLYNPIPAGSSNVLVRRELVASAGGFNPALQHFADWDLWARLAAASVPASTGSDPMVAYVRHASNMHIADIGNARREIALLADEMRARTGAALDTHVISAWLANGHRIGGRHWHAALTLAAAAVRCRSRAHARAAVQELAVACGRRRSSPDGLEPAPQWARPRVDEVVLAGR